MDNIHQDFTDKEASERRNSNTEWLLAKCRITKPPPPKPATNPLQFIKVAPCPLFQKAQEQIKKVEEIKVMRQDITEDAEEWQQNLDNWKSSRRKRQEHIIERVVEVKKIEQEEHDRTRRKSKTFNEMLEERNKRGQKLNILIYNDDQNDLSDYGIVSTSVKSSNNKDADTDDSSSVLDDKEQMSDSQSTQTSNISNQSQSEDESVIPPSVDNDNNFLGTKMKPVNNINSNANAQNSTKVYPNILNKPSNKYASDDNRQFVVQEQPQYTYEGAIQDYRSRIKLKINVDDKFLQKQDYCKSKETESQSTIPKVDIYKRKEIFEVEKPLEIHHFQSNTSRRLSEDFANSQSIKERLKSLEKCTDQPLKSVDKGSSPVNSIKSRIVTLNKQTEGDSKNNNSVAADTKCSKDRSPSKSISSYLSDNSSSNNVKNNVEWHSKDEVSDRCSSPEAEIYMNKLNMFNRDLDAFLGKSHTSHNEFEDDCESCIYPASNLSADLIGLSSDREDSGIHTADVSCSVSQADEPVEDTDVSSTTIPNCIEKLHKEKEKELSQTKDDSNAISLKDDSDLHHIGNNCVVSRDKDEYYGNTVIKETTDFINSVREQADNDFSAEMQHKFQDSAPKTSTPVFTNKLTTSSDNSQTVNTVTYCNDETVNYENVAIGNFGSLPTPNMFCDNTFPLAPPKTIEPPKEKPPPPPPVEHEEVFVTLRHDDLTRFNSTKRIKKELHIKRSSFLGLDEPTDNQINPAISLDKPPDINSFLQKESQLEKSLYKKLQLNRDTCLSEVESQDSGLESERGRLSSDTWCSSFGDLSAPSHGRQDSEQTNSVISEEDEVTKKEREIIELVEKEEKSRDINDYINCNINSVPNFSDVPHKSLKNLSNKLFKRNCFSQHNLDYQSPFDEQDSEVLKVEHELLQLEREELERRRDNIAFRENRTKMYLHSNRHSFENICDTANMFSECSGNINHRKSMPDLQNDDYNPSVPDSLYYKSIVDAQLQCHKSMPDIQQLYQKSLPEHKKSASDIQSERHMLLNHRKSMPELQHDIGIPGFQSCQALVRQPVISGKPLKLPNKEQRDKGRFMMINPNDSDTTHFQHIKPGRPITRPGIHALSAVPKSRPLSNDNWIQPKSNLENKTKNYNQHWLYQEAELRRLEEQQKNAASKRNWQQKRQEKHIPEPIIQTLTQRVQNRAVHNDRHSPSRRVNTTSNQEFVQHSYLNHPHTMGHASPLSYPPPTTLEDSQGVMLSVSGKKKCSYCNNELGRGAAMIIESLCLFYHIECFKCCVCHARLGDGLMGTDVRVRNQKLHCHNCYSSDDGVKFSCV